MANDLNLALPESVTTAFPYLAAGGEDSPCASYTVALAELSLPGLYGVAGFPGSKLFRSTAVAGPGSPPANDAELRELARQIATDFYLHMLAPCDVSFAGVVGWEPEGLTDWLEVTQAGGRISTRVRRGPWLDHAGELSHWGSYGSADDAVPSLVRVTSTTQTDGYYPGVLQGWNPVARVWFDAPGPVNVWLDLAGAFGAVGAPAPPPAPAGVNEVYLGVPKGQRPADGRTVYSAPGRLAPALLQVTGTAASPEGYLPAKVMTWPDGAGGPGQAGGPVWLRLQGTNPTFPGGSSAVAVNDEFWSVPNGSRGADGLPLFLQLSPSWRFDNPGVPYGGIGLDTPHRATALGEMHFDQESGLDYRTLRTVGLPGVSLVAASHTHAGGVGVYLTVPGGNVQQMGNNYKGFDGIFLNDPSQDVPGNNDPSMVRIADADPALSIGHCVSVGTGAAFGFGAAPGGVYTSAVVFPGPPAGNVAGNFTSCCFITGSVGGISIRTRRTDFTVHDQATLAVFEVDCTNVFAGNGVTAGVAVSAPDLFGTLHGDVVGNVTGDLTGAVTGDISNGTGTLNGGTF